MQSQNNQFSRNSLLLTIILPHKNGLYDSFHAAMLSFPQGTAQQVIDKLHNSKMLLYILDGLERDPGKLAEVSEWMERNGCPGVEITPVGTVGYYQLQTRKE